MELDCLQLEDSLQLLSQLESVWPGSCGWLVWNKRQDAVEEEHVQKGS